MVIAEGSFSGDVDCQPLTVLTQFILNLVVMMVMLIVILMI